MTQRPYFSRINQLARFLSREDEQGYAFACIQDERLLPAATSAIVEAAKNKYQTRLALCQLEQEIPLLHQLESALGENGGLIVQGLPHYLAPEGNVQSFNYAREGIVQLGRPILFWVDEPTLRRISNLATDLFSQRRMVVVYFDETAEIETPDDFLQTRFREEYRSQEEYPALELQLELKKKQLQEAEEAGLPAQRIATDFALPLAEAYAELDGQRKAMELLEKYQPADEAWPDDKLRTVGNIYWKAGKYELAIQCLEEALANAPKESHLKSTLLSKLGDVYRDIGKYTEARRYYDSYLSLSQILANQNPQSEQLQRDLSVAYYKLGQLKTKEGAVEEANQYYLKDLEIAEAIQTRNRESTELADDLLTTYLGFAERATKAEEALPFLKKLLSLAKELYQRTGQSRYKELVDSLTDQV
ncbi:MAG: tetratricopeptide repeat protein [Bacteroidetes bacterium]|nr:tetratricopeptide repeat protein [Bacteroidota bacterium]